MAVALARRGVGPGAHVALLGPTSRPLVTAIQAVWLAGATVVVLPLPMRMSSLDDFVAATRTRVLAADTTLLVADPMLSGFLLPEPGDPPVVLLGELTGDASDPWAWEAPKDDPSALAILQFTSGSTSDPKGVMLPHTAVCANLDAIAGAARLDPADDVLCSWLPLYHDMGLIGLLTLGMTTGTDLALAAPQDFLAAPARWMEWMSELADLRRLLVFRRVDDDPAGTFARERQVAAHQLDLVAEPRGAAGVAHHLLEVGEQLAGGVDVMDVLLRIGIEQGLRSLARLLVVGERQDRVADRVEGAHDSCSSSFVILLLIRRSPSVLLFACPGSVRSARRTPTA